jgi:hypothetical protein
MEIPSRFSVAPSITFEQAIALTQALLADSLPEPELESIITALVQTENGARGFFVTYLSDPEGADVPSPAVIAGLRTSPEIVAELLVKNLAMSTAMILTHDRNQNPDLSDGSKRVQQRDRQLIQALQLPQVSDKLGRLQQSLETGAGEYAAFLDRWHYDAEQRTAILDTVSAVVP